MKSLYLKAPHVGDVLIEYPSETRGRWFIDAARTHFGVETWIGRLRISVDAERGQWWRIGAAVAVLSFIVAVS